ncbi:uncharacterized protein [Haliotis cracherodii]|uniref:uncharacterized protein n=1 Tax=Haliotis cracherodii TaxID=6455 RepID=UPI0039ED0C6D
MSSKPRCSSLIDGEKSKIDIWSGTLGSQTASKQCSGDSGFIEETVHRPGAIRGKPCHVGSMKFVSTSTSDVASDQCLRKRSLRSTMRPSNIDNVCQLEDLGDSGTEEWGTVTLSGEEILPGMSMTTATSSVARRPSNGSRVPEESDHAEYSTMTSMSITVTELTSRCSTGEEEIEEEIIVAEREEVVHCIPRPVTDLVYINSFNGMRVKIKWPLSNGRFLRAVEDTDRPVLITDIYRREFKEQYYFIREIKNAIDATDRMYCLMCFRYDFQGQSFYLAPVNSTGDCQPETFGFQFSRANRSDVVTDVITQTNSKYWYEYQKPAFEMLRSFAYSDFYLSIETGRRVVLRNTHGQTPRTRNYAIQIFEDPQRLPERGSVSERFSRGVQSLLCIH